MRDYTYEEISTPVFMVVVDRTVLITRLWRIDVLPSGLHIDEAATAYSAYCLAHYGVDRYLCSWPVYLINFGGGQSALYAYFCAILFKIFPVSVTVIRIPAVVFSLLTVIFGVKLCKKLYEEEIYPSFLCGLLLIICPYFICAGRFGLDCNLMLGASTVFLFTFLQALKTDNYGYYVIAGITGGLILYTYALSYIILPLFLLLSVLYLLRVGRFRFMGWVAMAIPMGTLAAPLLLEQYVNAFDKPEMRLGIFTITKMQTYRASEIGSFSIEKFLLALKSVFLGDSLNYNSTPAFLNLYGITIVFFLIGLGSFLVKFTRSVRKRKMDYFCIPLIWFLSVLFMESLIDSNVNKINSIFYVTVLFAVEGVVSLCRIRTKLSYRMIAGSVVVAYLICFAQFGNYYFLGTYTRENYPLDYFDITTPEAIAFLEEHPEYQNSGTYMAENKIYYALSTLKSPYELNFYADDFENIDGYYCGTLPAIDYHFNYIVRDTFPAYADELRANGYTEISYSNYSLFYRK